MVGLAELESEKAKRERARKAREHGGKATPEQIQDRLQTAPSRKRSEPSEPKEWSRPAAAKSAGVSERKVRQAQEVSGMVGEHLSLKKIQLE